MSPCFPIRRTNKYSAKGQSLPQKPKNRTDGSIDLLVFDLKTMREVKRALRAHRAYTPNDECFFIFLDVSRDFVARSGGGAGWGGAPVGGRGLIPGALAVGQRIDLLVLALVGDAPAPQAHAVIAFLLHLA